MLIRSQGAARGGQGEPISGDGRVDEEAGAEADSGSDDGVVAHLLSLHCGNDVVDGWHVSQQARDDGARPRERLTLSCQSLARLDPLSHGVVDAAHGPAEGFSFPHKRIETGNSLAAFDVCAWRLRRALEERFTCESDD